jgi:hypothetical protein
MRFAKLLIVGVTSASLGGCACFQAQRPDGPNPLFTPECWFTLGVLGVMAGIVVIGSRDDAEKVLARDTPPFLDGESPVASDLRLKRDLKEIGTLQNGAHVYSFRYHNDRNYYSGVIAQELLQSDQTRHAVKKGPKGYYTVDYAALGAPLFKMDVMKIASDQALMTASRVK